MKSPLLVVTALLAFVAASPPARAITFTFSGMLDSFAVPTTDTYQILAFGAQGGSLPPALFRTAPGGLGAEIGGNFSLTAGEMLTIAVGGSGSDGQFEDATGGGGGSFVVGPGDTPLVIAGGGGGAGNVFCYGPGQGGLSGPDGGDAGGGGGGAGGTNGNGGKAGLGLFGSAFGGGGGGGFYSAGGGPGGRGPSRVLREERGAVVSAAAAV